jgi:hypothetical protein
MSVAGCGAPGGCDDASYDAAQDASAAERGKPESQRFLHSPIRGESNVDRLWTVGSAGTIFPVGRARPSFVSSESQGMKISLAQQ